MYILVYTVCGVCIFGVRMYINIRCNDSLMAVRWAVAMHRQLNQCGVINIPPQNTNGACPGGAKQAKPFFQMAIAFHWTSFSRYIEILACSVNSNVIQIFYIHKVLATRKSSCLLRTPCGQYITNMDRREKEKGEDTTINFLTF